MGIIILYMLVQYTVYTLSRVWTVQSVHSIQMHALHGAVLAENYPCVIDRVGVVVIHWEVNCVGSVDASTACGQCMRCCPRGDNMLPT